MTGPTNKTPALLPLRLEKVGLRKRGKWLLQDVTFDVRSNGITIVMGPNGCGKTTLLRLMHGLLRPRTGQIVWNVALEDARQRQAFVFQTPVMLRRNVIDNIAYPARLRGHSRPSARQLATEWAAKVGLKEQSKLEAQMLSGGERQKLAIARALIGEPDVLFMDEPTTNLDGTSTREIEAIIKDINASGTKVILATHDIGQARRLAEDVVFLNNGKLSEHTSAREFFRAPRTNEAKAYLAGDIVE